MAQVSTAHRPRLSVAVVITGVAPAAAATRVARRLAPPMWPESKETTQWPPSSITSTAGSEVLACTWAAMARTAIPVEPTNSRASSEEKCEAVQAESDSCPSP